MSRTKVSLYCTEGTSDKVYTIWVEKKDNLYIVEAQWGRRGGPQQSGTKTPKGPVALDKAEAIYDSVLKEKRAKGYHEGEDAPAFSQVEGAVDGGLRPMLLTQDDEANVEKYITDPAWGGQQKMNGKRIMLKVDSTKGVLGFNKRGLQCPLPKELTDAIERLVNLQVTFDGELIGGVYYAFDVMETGGLDRTKETYKERHKWLCKILATIPSSGIKLVDLALDEKAKRALLARLKAEDKEGIVFKRLDGIYHPGRIDNLLKTLAVKLKFYAEVAAVVIDWTEKQSVEVGLRGEAKVFSKLSILPGW